MSRRTAGTGSIRQQRSGRWQVRLTAPDGRQVGAGTFATKAEAERALRQRLSEADRGAYQDPRSGRVTLEAYAEAWLRDRDLTPRTRETYARSLRLHILPTLGRVPLDKITPALVRTWHAKVLEVAPTPARQSYATLRAILNTAVHDEALAKNPCRVPRAGTARSKERPLLSPDQVSDLAAAMPPHLQPLVTVAFWCHLRLGEVLALQWDCVDLDAGSLTVRRGVVEVDGMQLLGEPKADSRRTVRLPAPAVEALARHREQHPGLPSARLFGRLDGKPLRHGHVQHAWAGARVDVGLPEARLHDLRHAGLTLAAQSGATLRELMHRAGHKSSRAALIYQHLAASRDAEIAERMAEVAAQGSSGARKAHGRSVVSVVDGTSTA